MASQSENNSGVAEIFTPEEKILFFNDLIKTNCFVCHNPNVGSHDDFITPHLVGIKYRYKKSYSTREDFIENMSAFILNPNKEDALMRGPVRRFGLMSNTVLNEENIKEIVAYIYDNNLEEPTWFAEHFMKNMERNGSKNSSNISTKIKLNV
jgi:hypothetical protein